MTCYSPLEAWRLDDGSISFNPRYRLGFERLSLPCGQCIGCRLERSRQWAIRCVHEAQLWRDNCFITLTYDPSHLPADGSLCLRHWQLFMKRLRKKFGSNIRFFHCGEYGEKFSRPHYHACLFNFSPPDKVLFKTVNGFNLYLSKSLEELWGKGFVTIGDVTFESAAYVARYVLKKVTGNRAADYYSFVDSDGVVRLRRPEYVTMSRRPGIASGWYDKFSGDVFPSDQVIIRGRPMRPPRFYDNKLKAFDPEMWDEVSFSRFETAQKHLDNSSPQRLAVRHEVQRARLSKLPRLLEKA
nr:MAG: replication initiator protein [Microvirus sp.]